MRIATPLLTLLLTAACNQHPVEYFPPITEVGGSKTLDVQSTEKIDVLWVIDNSGSMCQEQRVLRDNFDRFVGALQKTVLDFHFGVTTTHMSAEYPLEPVAQPGHLQSTPQPLPGYDQRCWHGLDDDLQPDPNDWTPIRDLIDVAVGCMVEPDESFRAVTDDEIACAMGCSSPGMCAPDECGGTELFPGAEAFRRLPKVLKAEDYRANDGSLEIERLKADFACMSAVGMRGHGFEKGLGAAVAAVSPALTGGPAEAPSDVTAPNHGFLRRGARFATVFITDENDCTHDGRLNETQSCGGDICESWNAADTADSPLVPAEKLRDDLIANLQVSKGEAELSASDVLVASIHGRSSRYNGPLKPTSSCLVGEGTCSLDATCDQASYESVTPSCATELGESWSGDRYERFLRSFPDGQYYPAPNDLAPQDPLVGWMCNGDFRPALEAIGAFFNRSATGCVTDAIGTCEPGVDACPDHASGEPGACVPRPNSAEHYCDSFVEVRVASNDQASRDTLMSEGFCDAEAGGFCVLSPTHYALAACEGDVAGFKLEWHEPELARQALQGHDVELRWRAN